MGTPSDWVSGERVFAPPTGTFDVDWLVPAVVEAVPGTTPATARAALLEAWQDDGRGQEPAGVDADPDVDAHVDPDVDPLRAAARRTVDEALRTFRA